MNHKEDNDIPLPLPPQPDLMQVGVMPPGIQADAVIKWQGSQDVLDVSPYSGDRTIPSPFGTMLVGNYFMWLEGSEMVRIGDNVYRLHMIYQCKEGQGEIPPNWVVFVLLDGGGVVFLFRGDGALARLRKNSVTIYNGRGEILWSKASIEGACITDVKEAYNACIGAQQENMRTG
jgi:hypothetical protein